MSEIVEVLNEIVERHDCSHPAIVSKASAEITRLTAENERLRTALDLYRESVRIDVTMEGPKFIGSNASALKRAWDADCAALEEK